MQITALIVTHARSQWLERCIRSLRARAPSESAIDIRVLINGADAESRAVCEGLATEGFRLRARELWVPIPPPEARNRLWVSLTASAHAHTNDNDSDNDHWILFIDDDAYLAPEVLERLPTLLSQTRADIIGGPNLTPPQSPLFAQAVGVALASRFSTLLSFRRWRIAQEQAGDEASLTLCNLLFRACTLAAHVRDHRSPNETPFLPDFFYGEETRLIERLSAQGAGVLYTPEFWVWHERKSSFTALARQVFRSARGRARGQRQRVLRRHWVHALPSGSLCVLLLIAILVPTALPWILVPYLIFLLATVLKAAPALDVALLALAIPPLIHFSYALGYMVGRLYPISLTPPADRYAN